MARLSRAEPQERNRAKVLAAARDEFAERGFRDAKIDVIAERAELTRGAVYSNFPGKRALYFAVLAEDRRARAPARDAGADTPDAALGAFARAWLARLPLATDEPGLGMELLPEILTDEPTRQALRAAHAARRALLGLALERRPADRADGPRRRDRAHHAARREPTRRRRAWSRRAVRRGRRLRAAWPAST